MPYVGYVSQLDGDPGAHCCSAGGHDLATRDWQAAGIVLPDESAGGRLPVALTRQIWAVAEPDQW
jgi:hypothetical protein